MELNFIRRLLIAVIACTVTFAANAQTYTPETEAEGFVALYEAMLADRNLYSTSSGTSISRADGYIPIGRATSGIRSSPLYLNNYLPSVAGLGSDTPDGADHGALLGRSIPAGFTLRIGYRGVSKKNAIKNLILTHLTGKVSQTDIFDILTHLDIIGVPANARIYFLPGDIQARLDAARRFPAEQQAEREAEQQRLAAAQQTERQRLAALEAERQQVAADRQKLADLETEIAEVKAELESISRELVARAVAGMTPAPSADSGGSSGGGAIAAVAVIGGALYWFKLRNPKATYNFAAVPIDTDAYTAQLNYAPHENWNVNFEFTEGNLFAENDFIKPNTERTAKLTVRWVW